MSKSKFKKSQTEAPAGKGTPAVTYKFTFLFSVLNKSGTLENSVNQSVESTENNEGKAFLAARKIVAEANPKSQYIYMQKFTREVKK
ncbi:MAG: hypothetical protein AB9882_11935 [Ignavibacteriaceae bacterium]